MSIFAKVLEFEEYGQVLLYTDMNTEEDNDCDYSVFIKTQAPESSAAAYISLERGLSLESLEAVNDWFKQLTSDDNAMDALVVNSLSGMYRMFDIEGDEEEEDDVW